MTGGSVELQEQLTESAKREYSSDNVLVIAPESKDEQVATATQRDMIHASICYLQGYEILNLEKQRFSFNSRASFVLNNLVSSESLPPLPQR